NASSANRTYALRRPGSVATAEFGHEARRASARVLRLFAFFRLVSQPFTISFKFGECCWKERFKNSEPKDHRCENGHNEVDHPAGKSTPAPMENQHEEVEKKYEQHDEETGKENNGAGE